MKAVKIGLAGAGAFGIKHLEAMRSIEEAEVVALVEPNPGRARSVADRFGIGQVFDNLADCLSRSEVDAMILCTPTSVHSQQGLQCLQAGKHVQIEIPLADSLAGAEDVLRLQSQMGLVAMCGHTRRFNPSHQWIRSRIRTRTLRLQQLQVQTYFLRRDNLNALGEQRDWVDHLLWHHAAHSVDLFLYQTGEEVVSVAAVQGPAHPSLGIAMDMAILLKAAGGAICSISLSFNNDGPLGSTFRYVGDTGTYVARYDDLVDGRGSPVDLSAVSDSTNGIELQDREFIHAIRTRRQPNASVASVMPAYRILHQLELQLAAGR